MDYWRYNVHAEKGVDFFQANAHYWKTETDQVVGLFISEYGKDDFFIVVHPNFWALFSEIQPDDGPRSQDQHRQGDQQKRAGPGEKKQRQHQVRFRKGHRTGGRQR